MALLNMTAQSAFSQYEPQRQNNILLHIVGLSDPSDVDGGESVTNPDSALVLSLETFPIPKSTINPIEMGYLNEKIKFAGNPAYDDIQIVYKDLVNADAYRVLRAWRLMVHNDRQETTTMPDGSLVPGATGWAYGAVGGMTGYKRNGYVLLYPPDGTSNFVRGYGIIGMWPSQFDPGDADLNAEDYVRLNISFTVDKVYPLLPSEVSGLTDYTPGADDAAPLDTIPDYQSNSNGGFGSGS